MKRSLEFLTIVPAIAFGLSLSTPAFAQDTTGHPSASQSMEKAGADTENAAKNAYQGTATAVSDTDLTAKVKLALHNDDSIEHDDIHVTTVAGVVTLSGQVPNVAASSQAEQIARGTKGVRDVTNQLRVDAAASSDKD
jgi:hyperosmotically inducible protein